MSQMRSPTQGVTPVSLNVKTDQNVFLSALLCAILPPNMPLYFPADMFGKLMCVCVTDLCWTVDLLLPQPLIPPSHPPSLLCGRSWKKSVSADFQEKPSIIGKWHCTPDHCSLADPGSVLTGGFCQHQPKSSLLVTFRSHCSVARSPLSVHWSCGHLYTATYHFFTLLSTFVWGMSLPVTTQAWDTMCFADVKTEVTANTTKWKIHLTSDTAPTLFHT